MIIYVADVTKLVNQISHKNIFGQIIIGGERITYRQRNTGDNSVVAYAEVLQVQEFTRIVLMIV